MKCAAPIAEGLWGCKISAEATTRKGRTKSDLKCANLRGVVKLIFSLFKAAKKKENKGNLDGWQLDGTGERKKGMDSKIHFKSFVK